MASVREYFERSFPQAISVDGAYQITGPDLSIPLPMRWHFDFDAHAIYTSIFIAALAPDVLLGVLKAVTTKPAIFTAVGGQAYNVTLPRYPLHGMTIEVQRIDPLLHLRASGVDGTSASDQNFVPTRRVYLFFEQELTSELREAAIDMMKGAGFTVGIRDAGYATKIDAMSKPKAFISHDSRDKSEIARPLAFALQRFGCPVWYDEFSLQVGDSLRESIEHGLKATRFCVLVLTPNFLAKGGWPKREYDTAFTREVLEDIKVFLPIWHQVSKEDVYAYSPILADRVGIPWTVGVDEAARRIFRKVDTPDGD